MSKTKINVIFSDAGGILFNDSFAKLQEFQFLQQYSPLDYQDFSQAFYPFKRRAQISSEYTKMDAFRDFLASRGRTDLYGPYQEFCEEYHRKYFQDPHALLFPDVKETLEKIKMQRIPFIVLTDTTSTRKACEDFYSRLGILDYLTDIFSSADLHVKKPHPEFFSTALQKHPFRKEEVLFVGHDWDELYGAQEYGFQLGALRWKEEREEELRALENTFMLETFQDLLKLIE